MTVGTFFYQQSDPLIDPTSKTQCSFQITQLVILVVSTIAPSHMKTYHTLADVKKAPVITRTLSSPYYNIKLVFYVY